MADSGELLACAAASNALDNVRAKRGEPSCLLHIAPAGNGVCFEEREQLLRLHLSNLREYRLADRRQVLQLDTSFREVTLPARRESDGRFSVRSGHKSQCGRKTLGSAFHALSIILQQSGSPAPGVENFACEDL